MEDKGNWFYAILILAQVCTAGYHANPVIHRNLPDIKCKLLVSLKFILPKKSFVVK